MNFHSKTNPSTKCREIFGVNPKNGEETRIAILPKGTDDKYGDLLETALQVATHLHAAAPYVPVGALPELIKVARASQAVDDARGYFADQQFEAGAKALERVTTQRDHPHMLFLTVCNELSESRHAVLAQLRDVKCD